MLLLFIAGILSVDAGTSAWAGLHYEEIINFPDLIYGMEQTIKNKTVSPSCPSCGKPEPLLCQPDPYQTVCNSMGQKIRESAVAEMEKIETDSLFLLNEEKKLMRKWAKTAKEKFGPVPKDKKAAKAHLNRLYEWVKEQIAPEYLAIHKKFETEQLGPIKPTVKAVFQEALDVFHETIEKAPWSPEPKKLLLDALKKCDVKLLFGEEEYLNALTKKFLSFDVAQNFEAGFSAQERQRWFEGRAVTVRPLPGAQTKCSVQLTQQTWRLCAGKKAACYQILFHEFAHLINSCDYWMFAEGMKYEANRLGRADGNPELAEERKVAVKAQENAQIVANLTRAPACLSALSAPKYGVINPASDSRKVFSDAYLKRCGRSELKEISPGFDPQWNEAEADFWGATAWANWMERKIQGEGRMEKRREFLGQAMETWCAKDILANRALGKLVKLSSPMTIATDAGLPWFDPHQEWPVRWDRNYLRNSDLRRAIGCSLSPEVPMACSPYGRTVYYQQSRR